MISLIWTYSHSAIVDHGSQIPFDWEIMKTLSPSVPAYSCSFHDLRFKTSSEPARSTIPAEAMKRMDGSISGKSSPVDGGFGLVSKTG